jgi:hypothetical protein
METISLKENDHCASISAIENNTTNMFEDIITSFYEKKRKEANEKTKNINDYIERLSLSRDFTSLSVDQDKWNFIRETPGSFCRLYHSSFSDFTTWYLFHSSRYEKLFLIWKKNHIMGCREDINRVHICFHHHDDETIRTCCCVS